WSPSMSSTQIESHTPRPPPPMPPSRPRPPCPLRDRKISQSPEPTAPNVGAASESLQFHRFVQPSLANQAKLSESRLGWPLPSPPPSPRGRGCIARRPGSAADGGADGPSRPSSIKTGPARLHDQS